MKNLALHYLHRDAGNYKSFGSVIFANPGNLTPEEAAKAFEEQLISTEFFYCTDWDLPPLLPGDPVIVGEWYEFVDFRLTTEEITDSRTIEEFLKKQEKRMR